MSYAFTGREFSYFFLAASQMGVILIQHEESAWKENQSDAFYLLVDDIPIVRFNITLKIQKGIFRLIYKRYIFAFFSSSIFKDKANTREVK